MFTLIKIQQLALIGAGCIFQNKPVEILLIRS